MTDAEFYVFDMGSDTVVSGPFESVEAATEESDCLGPGYIVWTAAAIETMSESDGFDPSWDLDSAKPRACADGGVPGGHDDA